MKRLLCLFLVVIMALTVFAGCKKGSPNNPGTSDTDEGTHTDTNGSETEEPKKSWDDLPKDTTFSAESTPRGAVTTCMQRMRKPSCPQRFLPATALWSSGTESPSTSICMTAPSTL